MKHTIIITALALTACTTAPEPITDYNAPYLGGKGDTAPRTSPRPPARPDLVKCPIKSPNPGKMVKPGHEDVLCYGDPSEPKEPEKPEPPTECSNAGQWIPSVRYALSQKVCA